MTDDTTAAPTAARFDLAAARQAIEASNRAYGDNFALGDPTAFAHHYASDASIFPTHFPRMTGTAAINAFFAGAYGMGVRYIRLTPDEVLGGPELVVETGNYELLAEADVLLDKGKFIVVWKQENGAWKMFKDIWNSDLPTAR